MKSAKTSAPRVLVVSAGIGAGHNQAGRAIIETLRSGGGDLNVTSADSMTFVPRWFRAFYVDGFALMMTRFPLVYGLGYSLQNRRRKRPGRSVTDRLRLRQERRAMSAFATFVLETQPDLIVHTHFLAPPVVGRLIRDGRLKSRQFVVVTDNDVHPWWYSENVERWFLATEANAATLRGWEVPPRRITVSGIPVRPKWTRRLDRSRVLSDWRLPDGRDIVLLAGGTEFTCGPITGIARGILKACPGACLVVLAGRNKALLARLARLPGAGERLFPVSFTDRVNELVEVCSLMVTKAGGITTAECLSKGTPMVLTNPVPGQESANARYFQGQGAAVITRTPQETIRTVRDLLGNPSARAILAENARRLYKPAGRTIAEAIRRAVLPPGGEGKSVEP